MRTIETTATITAERTLTLQVPQHGPHHIVVWIMDDQPAPLDARRPPRYSCAACRRLAGGSLLTPRESV